MTPSSGWSYTGNAWAVKRLQEQTANNRLRHAYLFTGPQYVGRRTLALRFAQALNCVQPPVPGVPCGECRPCRLIERMEHPDLAIVQAAAEGGTLKVEQVRELQHNLSLAPYEARYRIGLLLRFEEAHVSAANALLKTLEEPPSRVILMLTAESSDLLPETVVSRCEVLRLRLAGFEEIRSILEKEPGTNGEQVHMLAHISAGRPGYALRMLHQPELLERRGKWLDDLALLLSSSKVERFQYVDTIYRDRELARAILLTWASLWRDVMLQAAWASTSPANSDRQEVGLLAQRLSLKAAHRALASVEKTIGLLERNANVQLALEVLMLDLPHVSAAPQPA